MFRVNFLGPGNRLIKNWIYPAAVSQRLRNTALSHSGYCLYHLLWHKNFSVFCHTVCICCVRFSQEAAAISLVGINRLLLVKRTVSAVRNIYWFVTWNLCCKGLRLIKFMAVVNNFVDIWFLLVTSAASVKQIKFCISHRWRTLNKVSNVRNSDDMAIEQH
jgi:hypothetical protein